MAAALTAQHLARGVVGRLPERALDRLGGRPAVVAAVLGALARRFDPAADAFAGEIGFALAGGDGEADEWTIAVAGAHAVAARGAPARPLLTIRTARADLLRLAAGTLDPGRALLDGRLDVEGDFALATRAAAMFGLRSPL
jgi:putative sterol carrier protein